jgi:hypothetical protein
LGWASEPQAADNEVYDFGRERANGASAPHRYGRSGVGRHQTSKISARLSKALEMAEMGLGDHFEPHRWDLAQLVVQGAIGPFDADTTLTNWPALIPAGNLTSIF